MDGEEERRQQRGQLRQSERRADQEKQARVHRVEKERYYPVEARFLAEETVHQEITQRRDGPIGQLSGTVVPFGALQPLVRAQIVVRRKKLGKIGKIADEAVAADE